MTDHVNALLDATRIANFTYDAKINTDFHHVLNNKKLFEKVMYSSPAQSTRNPTLPPSNYFYTFRNSNAGFPGSAPSIIDFVNPGSDLPNASSTIHTSASNSYEPVVI